MTTRRGGCHCERVSFEVEGELTTVSECNCSICFRRGHLHWIVERDRFHLVTGGDSLSSYRFNTGVAEHLFCQTCGVCSFYVPRSHPDAVSVNARCLERIDLRSLERRAFDGRNWEQARERELREESRGRVL